MQNAEQTSGFLTCARCRRRVCEADVHDEDLVPCSRGADHPNGMCDTCAQTFCAQCFAAHHDKNPKHVCAVCDLNHFAEIQRIKRQKREEVIAAYTRRALRRREKAAEFERKGLGKASDYERVVPKGDSDHSDDSDSDNVAMSTTASTSTSTSTTAVSLKEPGGTLKVDPGRLPRMKAYREVPALQQLGMKDLWPTIDAYLTPCFEYVRTELLELPIRKYNVREYIHPPQLLWDLQEKYEWSTALHDDPDYRATPLLWTPGTAQRACCVYKAPQWRNEDALFWTPVGGPIDANIEDILEWQDLLFVVVRRWMRVDYHDEEPELLLNIHAADGAYIDTIGGMYTSPIRRYGPRWEYRNHVATNAGNVEVYSETSRFVFRVF